MKNPIKIDRRLRYFLECCVTMCLLASCQTSEKCERVKNCQATEKRESVKTNEVSRSRSANGLSLSASFEDVGKKLVKVSWKNKGNSNFILTLPKRITANSDQALSWPDFLFSKGQVPSHRPTAIFAGFVQLEGETDMLTEHLSLNGAPLLENEAPIERVDWIELHPGQSVSAIFDLGTLFERVPKQEIASAKVWFGYGCKAHSGTNKEYWSGSVDSNVIELSR